MAYNGRRGSSIAEGSALVMVSSYIAWYLFLAGAGGGAFLLGSFVDFALRVSNRSWLRGASAVTDAGLLAGPVLVALGTVFLALDLGAPDQAFRLFLTPSGSLLSAGAWALALFCATAFAAFLMGFSDDGPGLRVAETVVSVFAALLALFVVLYAGVFLSLYPAVPFLNSPLVPIVFVASALATGAAVLTIIGVCGIRIMWIQFVFPHSRTFQTIMNVYPISLSATAAMIFVAVMYYIHIHKRKGEAGQTAD